jgi:hypothetical protein
VAKIEVRMLAKFQLSRTLPNLLIFFINLYFLSFALKNTSCFLLPIYKAISFNKIITKGGRTNPWVVLINANNNLKPYVVKLFETSLIEYRDSVANEVFGNVLAREFNLPVPNAALIDFDNAFLGTIRNQKLLEILDSRDTRLKFGSEMHEGYYNFDYKDFSSRDIKKNN